MVESLNCNQCGASLDVDDSTRFVTCRHCGSKLEIKRNASSAFTEVLDRIDRNTVQAADDLRVIRLEQEIERLDREWQMKNPGQPIGSDNPIARAGGAAALIVFGVIWCLIAFGIGGGAASAGAPAIFTIVPFLMGVFGIIVIGSQVLKAFSAQPDGADLTRRRAQLVDELNRLRRN
jgi:DNA-directed RNA polymerase subunit RPC12/RpoP